jgi:uncharacterized protein
MNMRSMKLFGVLSLLMVKILLVGCSSDDNAPAAGAALTVSGYATAGAAIVGTVSLKDSAGTVKTGTIGSDGSYSINVSGLTKPFYLKAEGKAGVADVVLYSVVNDAGSVNINPITDVAVAIAAGATNAKTVYDGKTTVTDAALTAAVESIKILLGSAGSALKTQNPLKDPIVIGNGIDAAFDVLKFKVEDGKLTVSSKLDPDLVLVNAAAVNNSAAFKSYSASFRPIGTSATVPQTLVFSGVKTPATDAEKMTILASSSVIIKGKTYPMGYNTILRSGDTVGGGTFGQLFDKNGNPLKATDGSNWISNDNDFSSLLKGKTDGKLYMVSHFEVSPSAMYLTELNQDTATGKLTAVKTKNIDFSSFGGGWIHCAGSVTPWGTHLGSEEYEPDARKVTASGYLNKDGYNNSQALYFGLVTDSTATDYYTNGGLYAYNYGWQIEVKVNSYTDVTPVKHYSMGRVAHELAYVTPNKKTAYITDDGANVGLFRYEADTAENLTSGELFVAKWNQTASTNGGSADLTWISMGKATDAEIKAHIDQKIKFTDIFETATPDATTNACAAGFTSINTTVGLECLKVKAGMEKAASRLETRRYAAMLGGTTEFNKMEGVTLDPDTKTLYIAMSVVDKGMNDNNSTFDKGGPNHIKLPKNICGTVYALDLDSNYVAKNMYGLVSGAPKTYDASTPYASNKCDISGISEPDNVTFMPGYSTLIIGEDTGNHQNDMIWAYNLKTKSLTRIQTTPYGSETTSPYFYPNINGWAYLMSVVQHPFGESDQTKATGSDVKRGYTGYIGPFPAMDK